jgi:hypothetical protein
MLLMLFGCGCLDKEIPETATIAANIKNFVVLSRIKNK